VAARALRAWLRAAVLQVPARHVEDVNNVGVATVAAQGMRHAHVANTATAPFTHASTLTPIPIPQHAKQRHHKTYSRPPAKIATPASGSDVAARDRRAWLRAAVLQVPALTLKMSTTLEKATVRCTRHQTRTRLQNTTNNPSLTHPPHTHTHPATRQTKTSQDVHWPPAKIATPAFGSDVAARYISSLAESCGTQSSRPHVEDVNNFGVGTIWRHCTRHETRSRRQQSHKPFTHASPSRSYPSCYTPNKPSQDLHWPPAKITASGSDVATR